MIKKLFRVVTEKPQTALDAAQDAIAKFMLTRYRYMSSHSHKGCAPTVKTTDQQIISIYKKVCTAFWEASGQRGEDISIETINGIVWKFLQVREMAGDEFLDEHLGYEIEKYIHDGLRLDYVKMSKSEFFMLPKQS